MSTDLGPLPDTPFGLFHESPGDDDSEGWQEFIDAPGYTADQMRAERERCYAFGVARERERRSEEMRAYAAAEVARERERCAARLEQAAADNRAEAAEDNQFLTDDGRAVLLQAAEWAECMAVSLRLDGFKT